MLAAAAAVLALAAPGPALGSSCADADSAWTTDTLTDWVSFSDQLAVIEVLSEDRAPPPGGPEGYAGLIGRYVTVRIERTLWRRPGAARPPERFRFNTWGWTGTAEDPHPFRVCDGARLEVGRRYLAPVTRRGEWFAMSEASLLLDGDRVVGGVDAGEPSFAHHELAGRTVGGAARVVRRTRPYRAAVRHRELGPARRWQEVNRDHYRVLGRQSPNLTVAAGVTDRARWTMYARRDRRGGLCLGLRTRGVWSGGGGSGETCGGRPPERNWLRAGFFASERRGTFSFGRTSPSIVTVVLRFAGRGRVRADTLPAPTGLGGGERYWAVPAKGDCTAHLIRGLDRRGREVARVEIPPSRVGSSPGC